MKGGLLGRLRLIGIQAAILNGARIGKNCLVGAKALIPEGREIPDNSVVLGAPAKVVREIAPEQLKATRRAANHYVGNWQRFKAGLEEDG